MKLIDFDHMYTKREINTIDKAEDIAKEIVEKYLDSINEKQIDGGPTYIDAILIEYQRVRGTKKEEILTKLLDEYHMRYHAAVREAIHHILTKEDERVPNIKGKNMPGIISVKKEGKKYKIDTKIGQIEVYKATDVLSSPVLEKLLKGQCYDRTYDYIKENPQYNAVVSYLPFFFEGGVYHAYAKNKDYILDIAANAFYEDLESANKVLNGEIVADLTLKEVKSKIKVLRRTIAELPKESPLLSVGLYYDIKNKR